MNSGPMLFLGLFCAVASSFWGLILLPQVTIGRQNPVVTDSGQPYPWPRPGVAQQGADVYRANGCVECHTQQVRRKNHLIDPVEQKRGWGTRFTVAQDYLRDTPVLLGAQRIGPDLANAGLRVKDENQALVHLYNPRLTVPTSIMPRYEFLFEPRMLSPGQALPVDALRDAGLPANMAIVPKPEAHALTAYLMSLQANEPLFETAVEKPKTNKVAQASVATNAPAASAK